MIYRSTARIVPRLGASARQARMYTTPPGAPPPPGGGPPKKKDDNTLFLVGGGAVLALGAWWYFANEKPAQTAGIKPEAEQAAKATEDAAKQYAQKVENKVKA